MPLGRKFGNPMVLAPGSGCPAISVSWRVKGTSPEDGIATYIEAISAMDTITKPMQTAVTRNMTIAPPVPPFVSGMMRVLKVVRYVAVMVCACSRQYGLPRRHQDHRVTEYRHETEVAPQLLLFSHTIHILLVHSGSSFL